MEQKLQKLFKQSLYQPKNHLSDDIWNVIENKNIKISRYKKIGYLSISALSLLGSVFSIKTLIEQLVRFGFYDYLSLAFSDSGVIITYWKEYILTLANSLPAVSTIFSFALLFVLFVSIRRASFQFKNKLLTV